MNDWTSISAAILDILCRCRVISETDWQAGKELLARIVAMLKPMMSASDRVRDPETVYGYGYGYGYGEEQRPNQPLQPAAVSR